MTLNNDIEYHSVSIINRYSHHPQARYQYAPILPLVLPPPTLLVGRNVTLVLLGRLKVLSASSMSHSFAKLQVMDT